MRLMYFVPCDVVGGAEKQLEYLVKQLKTKHSILISYMSQHVEPWLKTLGVPIQQVYSPNTLMRAVNTFRPDIFQFYHSVMAYQTLKKIHPKPKVVEVVHNRHWFNFDSTTYPKDITDLCICVSPDAEANFLTRCPSTQTMVIPNGVDVSRFNPSIRKPLNQMVGGYTGRMEGGNGKGIESLINIMSKLPVKFEFVGQDLASWKKIIDQHPNLSWYPHTNKPEDYYAKWDFFVSMSPNEGFGLSIAEAVSCGIPSIVYDCGGVTHYLEHEKHALIAQDELDVKNFINRISTFNPIYVDLSDKTMAERYEWTYLDLLGVEVKGEQTKINVLGTCPTSWSGVKHAITEHISEFCDITRVQRHLKLHKVETVYFGGFLPEWTPILHLAKKRGVETVVSIHHTPMLGEFNKLNTDSLETVVREFRLGNINRIDTPSLVVSRILNNFGIECFYIPNKIQEIPKDLITLPGINIGIFGSGMPWKNFETQVIAAALYAKTTPGVRIHTQTQLSGFCRSLGIDVVVHPQLPRDKFLRLAGSMTLNMAIGMTETFGYFARESFLMGVPCLWSMMTPSMRLEHAHLCQVMCIDDPIEIAHHIRECIESRDAIIKDAQEWRRFEKN